MTGCAGFIGRNYVDYLKWQGWDVYGMDVTEGDDVRQFFLEDRTEWYDLVVHAAYEVGGRAHIDGSNMALATNVALDSLLFDWALRTHQGSVLYFSSSAAYPVKLQTNYYNRQLREDDIDLVDPAIPDANYGWAKLTGEKIAHLYGEQGGRVHVVRPFSGYGGDQSLSYPFPSILKRARKKDLSVWGPPGQTRDWIHINDVLKASLTIVMNDERRPVNLGTGVPTTMGALMTMAYEKAHGHALEHEIKYLIDKPTGVYSRVCDPTRMLEHYTPEISLLEGVEIAYGG